MNGGKLMRVGLLLVLGVAIVWAVLHRNQFDVAVLQRWVHDAGVWAPLLFMAVYAVATVLFLPGSMVTLAGGALFGPAWGTLYNLTGATIGATLAFLIARYLASDWARNKAGGRIKQVIEGVEAEGWHFMAVVRLVPLFPFNFLNYALGLTRIGLGTYVGMSFLCMLPGAIAYTYLGYAGREAVAGGAGLIQKGMLALGLLAVVIFLPRFVARLRKPPMLDVVELKCRLDAGENLLLLDVRNAPDFAGELGHIPGATHIPLQELGTRLDEIASYQAQPVMTVCRTDRMSTSAAQMLARKGFTNVRVVRQGMTDWNKQGYPVER